MRAPKCLDRILRRLAARMGPGRPSREADLDAEIRAHIQMAIQDRMDRGESREEAERTVRREFGNEIRVKEVTRRQWQGAVGMWLDRLRQDLRYAFRNLKRNPGFSLTAIVTLGIGIGATAAVFSMAEQLLLEPLPGVTTTDDATYFEFAYPPSSAPFPYSPGNGAPISQADFEAIRSEATLLDGLASYRFMRPILSNQVDRPIQVSAYVVYGDFFEVLGVASSAGRLLSAEETSLESDPYVVVLGNDLATTLFGSAEGAVGRSIQAAGATYTVVGVAGGGFKGLSRTGPSQAWFPWPALASLAGFPVEALSNPEQTNHSGFVALPRQGVGMEMVEAQVRAVVHRLRGESGAQARRFAELTPRFFPGLRPPPMLRSSTSRFLRLLAVAAALVLSIACANVASLLLFRNLARRGALAMRRALGASSARIARQRLTESTVLGTLGALAGVGLAWALGVVFRGQALPGRLPFDGFGVHWSTVGFVAVVTAVTTLFFGTVPALLAGRFNLSAAVGASRDTDTGRLKTARAALSVTQIALTLSLVVGGLLMARTLRNLSTVETGLDIEGVASISFHRPSDLEPDQARGVQRELLRAVARLPGVESAALDVQGPHGPLMFGRVHGVEGSPADAVRAAYWPVTPGWFELFRARVVAGRTFRDSDWESSTPEVVVLTSSLARRIFGRTDVVGRTLRAGLSDPSERRVVGVIEDYRSLTMPDRPTDAFFVPYSDAVRSLPVMTLLARTRGLDPELGENIRATVESILPDVPVPEPALLTDRVNGITSQRSMLARLLWLLSAFGLLMSAVGLYGVIAFMVSGRRREIGVRVALGAGRARVARLVLRSAAWIVGIGLVLGLGGGYALSRMLESRLFRVEPFDPTLYSMSAVILGVTALLATWIPTRSAMRVDPMSVLREE